MRRCFVGRLDERRPNHPSAVDHHERCAIGAFRSLGHPQRGHRAGRAARDRRTRRRAHRRTRGPRLRSASFSAGRSLRQRGRRMDVRPRLARAAHGFRGLAGAHRPDGASLYAGRRALRPVVPCIVRGARRCRYSTGAGLLGNRFGDLRRGLSANGTHICKSRLEQSELDAVLADGLR